MVRFVVVRTGQSLLVLLIVSFLSFLLIGLMPGDPIDLMTAMDPRVSSADAARLKAAHGLQDPLLERYGAWLAGALQGEFGDSRLFARPVGDILLPRIGNSLQLLLPSLVLAIAIAVPLGVAAARRVRSRWDAAINLMSIASISTPAFWLALLLILVFAVHLGWLPSGGETDIGGDGGFLHRLPYLVLPVATLVLVTFGTYARHVRAAMIEVLRQDHVRTARAKGAREGRVMLRHALPNAALPLITVVGLDLGALFGGALVVETMFAFPGMGKLIHESVLGSDFPLALSALVLATMMILLGNLLADLIQARLDPRADLPSGPGGGGA